MTEQTQECNNTNDPYRQEKQKEHAREHQYNHIMTNHIRATSIATVICNVSIHVTSCPIWE